MWFQLSGVAASIILVGGLIWNFTSQNETEQLPAFENTIVNGKETNNNEINSKTKFSTDESLVYDSKEKNNEINSLESDQQNNNKSKIYKENLLNKQNKINSGKTNTIITYNELEKNTDSNYKRK